MQGRWPREVHQSLGRMLQLAWSLFNTEQDPQQATLCSKGESAECSVSPLSAVGMRGRQVIFLIMTALGLPLQRLLRELQAPPSCFSSPLILLRQSACSVKRELREGLLCLSSFGESLGVSPEHLFIVRSFLPPASLDSWILSMCWEVLQDGLRGERNGRSPQEGCGGEGLGCSIVRGCQEGRKGHRTPKVRRRARTLELTRSMLCFLPILG